MKFFQKISQCFSAKSAPKAVFSTVEYKGFTITPQPMMDGGQFRVAAMIEKVVSGTLKQHHFIRSDTLASADKTAELTVIKCKILIDQAGEGMFK